MLLVSLVSLVSLLSLVPLVLLGPVSQSLVLRMMSNVSQQVFVLEGLVQLGVLRLLLFLPFFLMFLVALLANALLLYVIVSRRRLHSPMFVLMGVLAGLDLSLPLFFAPPLLLDLLLGRRSVSLLGCLLQIFWLHLLGTFQSTVLLWMALDRYFAICSPLLYRQRMAPPSFLRFVIPLAARNVLMMALLVALAGRLRFCGHVIRHSFCEHMALVALACGATTLNNAVGLLAIVLIPVTDFVLIVVSYGIIFRTARGSAPSGAKALRTCVTHVVVMSVSLGAVLVAFLSYRVQGGLAGPAQVCSSVMYLLFPSCFNPIIYGVRTSEIRQVLSSLARRRVAPPPPG